MPGHMRFNPNAKKGRAKDLFKAMKPYAPGIILAFVFIAASSVMAVIAPQYVKTLTNTIVDGAATRTIDMNKIAKIGVILIIFYLTDSICHYISNFIMTTVTQRYVRRMRNEISHKINRVPLKYFDAHQYGDTLSIITNDVDTVGQSMDQAIAMFMASVMMLVGVLIAMFITAWQMALAVIAILPLMLIMLFVLSKLAMPQFAKNQRILGEMNGIAEENYSGQTVIKAFDASERKIAQFEKANSSLKRGIFRGQTIAGFIQPAMTFISYFSYVAVCVVGGLLISKGDPAVDLGTISAFLVYAQLFQNPLNQLGQAMTNFQMAAGAATRVYEFLGQEELSDETGKERKLLNNDGTGTIRGDVEFKNVRFGYDPEKIIIPDFSAKVKAGMKVAIVGPTGAGKTTMVNLLMRFYELQGGDITVDGVSIKDMPREEVHDIFGMVLQDTWMFEGSIRDNILFSKTGVSDEGLEKICREAGIYHYVRTLPGGLDCVMGEDSNISGGQKQLITIARAMAENSPLLILDEATSNVDTRTEEVIQRAMDKLTQGRTSFVIAHRLSTIRNADLILVMKDGNIIEQGNHEALIAENGFYANLYNSQFANE